MNGKHLLVVAMMILLPFAPLLAEDAKPLITEKQKVSYSIGLSLGANFSKQSLEIDAEALKQGVLDAMSGAQPKLTEAEMKEVMTNLQKRMIAKKQEADAEVATKNLEEGEEFLAENKKREGVKTLPSGLQYEVIEAGDGKSPEATDTVVTNYKGTLIDGTEFDSSYKRGKPATFPVNGVIKGWTEVLQLMKTGAKWKVYVPSDLAYGNRGAGPLIGPNSTLIFEIELLEVK